MHAQHCATRATLLLYELKQQMIKCKQERRRNVTERLSNGFVQERSTGLINIAHNGIVTDAKLITISVIMRLTRAVALVASNM